MVGGIINMISNTASDLYLTGAPQITFYKMVYRRYTNFAMESISLDFDDDIKFDYESELIPPRAGDLLHKAYLQIEIPRICISKFDLGIDISDIIFECSSYADKDIILNYEKIQNIYMEILTNIYRIVFRAVNASNVTYIGLFQDVREYINVNDNVKLLKEYDDLLIKTRIIFLKNNDPRENILDYTRSNLWYVLSNINVNRLYDDALKKIEIQKIPNNCDEYNNEINRIMKNTTLLELSAALEVCKNVQKIFFGMCKSFIQQVHDDKNPNIRCAWVNNLGHSIIEYIDVYIGGKRIDRHLGIWISIWHQLTYKYDQISIYNELIGNVPQLTNFDYCEKPQYTLYIPLTFWFNKFNGCSFPLIAMQYNDIRFNIKLRKFEEVFHIEKIYRVNFNGTERILTANLIDYFINRIENKNIYIDNIEEIHNITLSDIWDAKGRCLHGHILMDYIFLENSERRKFAQSGHEYLIERIQYDTHKSNYQTKFDVHLDFTNPSKEIIWVIQKDIFTNNIFGWNKCQWENFTIECTDFMRLKFHDKFDSDIFDSDILNPIESCSISFNSYTRVEKQVGKYFDVLQPLYYHNISPKRGINMYSFCIDPLQPQPTGACNFSRLSDVKVFMQLNPLLYRYREMDVYPYDNDKNFVMTITNLDEFMERIDINLLQIEIKNYEAIENYLSFERKYYLNNIRNLLDILYNIKNGTTRQIELKYYRLIYFKTNAKFTIFSLTVNILRLINGYGALAFPGDHQ